MRLGNGEGSVYKLSESEDKNNVFSRVCGVFVTSLSLVDIQKNCPGQGQFKGSIVGSIRGITEQYSHSKYIYSCQGKGRHFCRPLYHILLTKSLIA